MKEKAIKGTIGFAVLCVITVVIDCLQWKLTEDAPMRGLGIMMGTGLVIVLFVVLLIWSLVYLFKVRCENKKLAFVPVSILAFVLIVHIIFPLTDAGLYAFYQVNKGTLKQIVQMQEEGIDKLVQNSMASYALPGRLQVSMWYTNSIFMRDADHPNTLIFYVHRRIGINSAIMYVPEGEWAGDGGFGRKFLRVIPLDPPHWYGAILQ